MRESCTSGSVRGASSDRRLYSTLPRTLERSSVPPGCGALQRICEAAGSNALELQDQFNRQLELKVLAGSDLDEE